MTKSEFLSQLCAKLCHLPKEQQEFAYHYYSGVIDCRIQDGMDEQQAVEACASPEEAALEFIRRTSTPQKHIISRKIKSMPPVLRVVLSGTLSAFCFGAIAVMWIALACLYVAAACIGLSGAAFVICGFIFCFIRTLPIGICGIGAGIILFALMLLMTAVAGAVTKAIKILTATVLVKVRGLLAKEALAV